MEQQLKPTPFKYLLQSTFGGKSCSQIVCQGGCGTVRNNIEDFYNLSLEVKNHKNLKESLEKFISEERIEDYKCESCKKNVTLTKRNSIAELPNILIVHLQRILFDYETLQNNKINSKLEFPEQLNLKAFTSEVLAKGNEVKREKEEISEYIFYEKEDSYYDFDLVGVVVHTGSADAGHYYSFINVRREGTNDRMIDGKESKENWLEFNDSNIYSFNTKNLDEECFGVDKANNDDVLNWMSNSTEDKEKCKNAYMLIYERRKKKPLKIVVDHPENKENMEFIEVNNSNRYELFRSIDTFNSENVIEDNSINKKLFYDKEKEEFFRYEGFYEVEKLIPNRHFTEVHIDNMVFLNDQKLFNTCFNRLLFTASRSLRKLRVDKQLDDTTTLFLAKVIARLSIEVIPASNFKDYVSEIVQNLCLLMYAQNDVSSLLLDALMANKNKLSDIIFSTDENSNQAFKKLFVEMTNTNFEIKVDDIKSELFQSNDLIKGTSSTSFSKEKPQIIDFLDHLISWIPHEISKNWVRMGSFLEVN